MGKVQLPEPLSAVLDLADRYADDRESLSEFASKASLTPVVMMGQEVIQRVPTEVLHNINQVQLSVYTGMYLKCIQFAMPISKGKDDRGITVEQLLEPLSDKRAESGSSRVLKRIADTVADISLESYWSPEGETALLDMFDAESYKEADVQKHSNLAVGKIIEVPLSLDGKSGSMTISAVINPQVIQMDFMQRVLEAFIGKDQSFIGRFQRYWKTGEIKSFAEYALSLDIIEEDRALRLEDPDGIYNMVKRNRSRGLLSSFLADTKPMNIASHMIVTTDEGRRDLERAMRGKITRYADREKFFKATGTMIFTSVNTVRETVSFFQRGVESYGTYSFDSIKSASKDPGHTDISSILKEFRQGESFSLGR